MDNTSANPQTFEYNNANGFETTMCEFLEGKTWLLTIWQWEQIECLLFRIGKEIALLITRKKKSMAKTLMPHIGWDLKTRKRLWLKKSKRQWEIIKGISKCSLM